MWSFVSVPRYPSILSVPPEERRKGGICGGGIPPEKQVRRKKEGKLALFWEI